MFDWSAMAEGESGFVRQAVRSPGNEVRGGAQAISSKKRATLGKPVRRKRCVCSGLTHASPSTPALGCISFAMRYDTTMVDRQVGRNAELFAQSIAELDDREERYPYLRILISLVDQAHPEWRQAPNKVERIAELAVRLSEGALDPDEVQEVVRVRDKEKGYHS